MRQINATTFLSDHFDNLSLNKSPWRMSFVPRQTFSHTLNRVWFPGHMTSALRQIGQRSGELDLVLEVRDARVPLSSRNPFLEKALVSVQRLILYNKSDICGSTDKEVRRQRFTG